MKRFDKKTILITGGGGDIGSRVARRIAKEGASIALLDVEAKSGAMEELQGELKEFSPRVDCFASDVTDATVVGQTIDSVVKDFGGIDCLFNNAGYQGLFRKFHEYPVEDFRKVLDVNLIGAFNVLQSVSVHMVERRRGAVVNVASMAGVDAPPNMAAYAVSKFGMVGLTSIASKDLAPYNIRVNAISPAFMGPGFMWERQVKLQSEADSQYYSRNFDEVAKQMINSVPMRRYGDLDEIPGTVLFLLSEDASYITGVNIPISGGIR